ncbi:MAG: autotransporter domain-containing protein [Hyphomicrobiales bacterium]
MMSNSCNNSKFISNISYEITVKKTSISPFARSSRCVPHFASRQLRSLTKRLALCSALVVPALAAPMMVGIDPAYAVCTPVAASNVTATCTGDTVGANVYGTGAESNVDLTVLSGATLTGTGRAIFLDNNIVLTNFGAIRFENLATGGGGSPKAIQIDGTLTALNNSGSITAVRDGINGLNFGLQVRGAIERLTNTGEITSLTTGNSSSIGIQGVISVSNIANFGTISAVTNGSASSATGLLSNNGLANLSNSGTISAEALVGSSSSYGIHAQTITGVVNTGTIRASSSGDSVGVRADTRLASLTNAGTISGNSFAIRESGAGDTSLTLNAGSVLISRVDLGGGANVLNIGQGLSLNSTFESDGGASLVELGSIAGHLIALVPVTGGGTNNDVEVVAVDPFAFASADEALAALTAGIGQTVQNRQAVLRSDPALGFSAGDATDMSALNPSRFWVEGFGAYREDNGDRVGNTFDSLTGGLVAGVDVPVGALTSVGVMAGFAASTSENETNTQETDTTSYYAGVYASTQALGLAWDASLTVGHSDYDQERITANNLVANGLETARADIGGWFINPQVTATREAANPLAGAGFGSLIATQMLEQSLTFSYAGLFLDGYTETGTTNPLTLDDRDVHIASARAALALPFEAIHANGALTTVRLIGGVEVRTQFGDDAISGTLLGQSVSTTLDDDDVALGGFLGLSGEYQTTSGLIAYANAEGLLETDASWQLSADAGLRIAF